MGFYRLFLIVISDSPPWPILRESGAHFYIANDTVNADI